MMEKAKKNSSVTIHYLSSIFTYLVITKIENCFQDELREKNTSEAFM